MFRSRPVQYLGLLLLVLACLGVIFFPIGAAPQPQDYSVHLSSAQPFEALAKAASVKDKKLAGKSATDIANSAIDKVFSDTHTTRGKFEIAADGRTASVVDYAATRPDANERVQKIKTALAKVFPGTTIDERTQKDIDKLPITPLLTLGQSAIFPLRRDTAIKRGLDLQGGVNLVLQVRKAVFTYTFDKKLASQDERDAFAASVRDALAAAPANSGLNTADVSFTPGAENQIEVRTQAATENEFQANKAAVDAAIKTVPGTKWTLAREPQFFQPKTEAGTDSANFESQRLDRTVEIVRARIDTLGVSEPLIQKQGTSRIVVQLPGEDDPKRAVATIGTTAQMEIYLTPETLQADYADPGNVRFRDKATGRLLSASEVKAQSELVVEGDQVKPVTSAGYVGDGGNTAGVFFELYSKGATNFAEVTRRVAGKKRVIPIFLDERCITAPTVESAITGGKGQISGGFADLQEARDLAQLLNSGALPAPIDVIENRTISATLGADSLRKSLYAGLIGLALVAGYMIAFYRLAGILANCALVIYIALNLAAFILIGGTLTLPGIAGFLLAIAMSLDTNILVFERLREEMAIQPTFAAALRAAFSRAWTAILDSHVTTLIAAVVLFNFGTGPVKGFALTLGIGVLLSLFSAISVTRLFMWSVAGVGERNQSAFGDAAAPTTSTPATAK